MDLAAIADQAELNAKVRELVEFSVAKLYAQRDASEIKKARAEIRIRRIAREAEAAAGGLPGEPAAQEA